MGLTSSKALPFPPSLFEFIIVVPENSSYPPSINHFVNGFRILSVVAKTEKNSSPSFSVFANVGRKVAVGRFLMFLSPKIAFPKYIPKNIKNIGQMAEKPIPPKNFLTNFLWLRDMNDLFAQGSVGVAGAVIVDHTTGKFVTSKNGSVLILQF